MLCTLQDTCRHSTHNRSRVSVQIEAGSITHGARCICSAVGGMGATGMGATCAGPTRCTVTGCAGWVGCAGTCIWKDWPAVRPGGICTAMSPAGVCTCRGCPPERPAGTCTIMVWVPGAIMVWGPGAIMVWGPSTRLDGRVMLCWARVARAADSAACAARSADCNSMSRRTCPPHWLEVICRVASAKMEAHSAASCSL